MHIQNIHLRKVFDIGFFINSLLLASNLKKSIISVHRSVNDDDQTTYQLK